MAKKSDKFKIGDWVNVHRGIYFYYDLSNERLFRTIDFREEAKGQIVGATIRRLGKKYWAVDEPTSFEAKGGLFVWKVRLGLSNQSIDVLEKDLELIEQEGNVLPWRA